MKEIRISLAASENEIEEARKLFREYATGLGFSLHFQGFDEEIAGLPGEYSAPGGCILLARSLTMTAGCVALRRIDDETCEMKRMFVREEFRNRGIGRLLAEAVIREAKDMGYGRMRLDTLASMVPALTLYRSLGFHDIGPYRFNPMADATFMELSLR